MDRETNSPYRWQRLKNEWTAALDQGKHVTVAINVLYPSDGSQQPVGLDARYTIDGESFTRTFRGIPEGYDAVQRRER